tara:strand:+ start:494 stop:877 length:384 start_codon:yes stop_codon:yes gene_type:complete
MSTIKVTNLQDTSGGNSSTSEQIARGRAKAWVNFDGTFGTSPFTEANGGIRDSFNVTSVTDVGTGQYTVNFTNALSSSNYVVVGMNHYGISHRGTSPFSTTSFDVVTYNTSSAANTDYDYNDLAFFD